MNCRIIWEYINNMLNRLFKELYNLKDLKLNSGTYKK